MKKNMWMVSAGSGAFLVDEFKNKNYVAIGWNELGDISGITRKDRIKELVEKSNYYKKKSQIGLYLIPQVSPSLIMSGSMLPVTKVPCNYSHRCLSLLEA